MRMHKSAKRIPVLMATGSLLGGLAIPALTGWAFTWWVLVMAMVFVIAIARLVNASLLESRQRKVDAALSLLDGIYKGKRFVGSTSVAIATKRSRTPDPGLYQFEQLCKTATGQWFVFSFTVHDGPRSARDFEVTPSNDDEARYWLSQDLQAYKRHFGEPEVA